MAKLVLPARLQARLRAYLYPEEIALVPVDELERVFRRALEHLRDETGQPVGDYLEFGVFRGDSLLCMARVRNELGLSFRLVGFDSFEGLPALGEGDSALGDTSLGWAPGRFRSSFARTRRRLESAGLGRDEAILVKGWYESTLTPESRRRLGIEKASTIMIDCDLYSSARAALEYSAPLIEDEAVVFFDDWDAGAGLGNRSEGEARAFAEFSALHPELVCEEFDSYRHTEIEGAPVAKVFRVRRVAGTASSA